MSEASHVRVLVMDEYSRLIRFFLEYGMVRVRKGGSMNAHLDVQMPIKVQLCFKHGMRLNSRASNLVAVRR